MKTAGYSLLFVLLALAAMAAEDRAPDKAEAPPGMVLIPEGWFWMGSPVGEGNFDEYPQRRVWIDAFYMDTHEVTNAQYGEYCDATGAAPPADPPWDYEYFASKADYPVIKVSWADARDYCAWRNKRLPTEAEWEKAARGGLDRKEYPWGGPFDCTRGNFDDEKKHDERTVPGKPGCDGHIETAPAGSFEPNGYGLYDMAGNVWEWCSDWYAFYDVAVDRNPKGPSEARARVVRGGSWYSPYESSMRSANRYKVKAEFGYHFLGFRCVSDAETTRGTPELSAP